MLEAVLAAVRSDASKAAATTEAAARTGAAGEQVQVQVQDVVWSDSSLGCPQPGQLYVQALVPGWRIEVKASAFEAVYHASRQGHWLWCPQERAQPPRGATVAR